MNKKTVAKYVEDGFEQRTVEMLVRKNGKYLQVVIEKDGQELFFLMQACDKLFPLKRREAALP